MGHVLDYVLDHMITGLLTMALDQATYLIKENPPRFKTGNLNKKKSKLTRLKLAITTNKISDSLMEVTIDATTIKKIWTRLYNQYHKVGWGAESNLFRELISLRQSKCKNTKSYFANF